MVNKAKSKSDAAVAELREKLAQLEGQLSRDIAGRLSIEIGKVVGTLTVELAKVQREIAKVASILDKDKIDLSFLLNTLAGDIRKLQSAYSPEYLNGRAAEPAPAPEPSPKTNGEKHLNTLPWLTGERIPEEGTHPVTFLGNVREWVNARNQKRFTGDFDFNGTKYSYTMAPELYEVVADRADKQKPISVKRDIYKDNPCVRFVWN